MADPEDVLVASGLTRTFGRLPLMTALENVSLAAEMLGRSRTEAASAAGAALDAVGGRSSAHLP